MLCLSAKCEDTTALCLCGQRIGNKEMCRRATHSSNAFEYVASNDVLVEQISFGNIGHPHLDDEDDIDLRTLIALHSTSRSLSCSTFQILRTRYKLEEAQARAVITALRGKNCFITGSAGTGKSYVTNIIRRALTTALPDIEEEEGNGKSRPQVIVAAPTGIAAWQVNGHTLCSLIGARRVEVDRVEVGFHPEAWTGHRHIHEDSGDEHDDYISTEKSGVFFAPKRITYVQEHLSEVKALIIDEISMADEILMKQVCVVIADALGLPEGTNPFQRISLSHTSIAAPVQLIVVGDFNQLPPVLKKESPRYAALHTEQRFCRYLFQSPFWKKEVCPVAIELCVKKRTSTRECEQILQELSTGHNNNSSEMESLLHKLERHVPETTMDLARSMVRNNTPFDTESCQRIAALSNVPIFLEILDQIRDGKPLDKERFARLQAVTQTETVDEQLGIFGNRAPKIGRLVHGVWKPYTQSERQCLPCVDNWNNTMVRSEAGKVHTLLRVDTPDPRDPHGRIGTTGVRKSLDLKAGCTVTITHNTRIDDYVIPNGAIGTFLGEVNGKAFVRLDPLEERGKEEVVRIERRITTSKITPRAGEPCPSTLGPCPCRRGVLHIDECGPSQLCGQVHYGTECSKQYWGDTGTACGNFVGTCKKRGHSSFKYKSTSAFYPLEMAYGLTAHKSQGRTIRRPMVVRVDQAWEAGQRYVMLSRASDPKQMRLVGSPEEGELHSQSAQSDQDTVQRFNLKIRREQTRARPFYCMY